MLMEMLVEMTKKVTFVADENDDLQKQVADLKSKNTLLVEDIAAQDNDYEGQLTTMKDTIAAQSEEIDELEYERDELQEEKDDLCDPKPEIVNLSDMWNLISQRRIASAKRSH